MTCLLLALAARGGAQPPDRSTPFRFNSAGGIFSMQGSFAGSYTVEPDHIELRLDECDIFASDKVAAGTQMMVAGVEFGLATDINDKGGWNIKRRAREIPVGRVFTTGSRLSLGPITVSIPIDNTMALARHWIIVSILGPRLPAPDNRPSVMWHTHSAFDIFSQNNVPLAPPPAQPPAANPPPVAQPPAQAPPAAQPPAQAPVQAPAPPAQAPAPAQAPPNGGPGVFRFNSVDGAFAVQGNFAGRMAVLGDRVEMRLDEAGVFIGRQMHFSTRRWIGSVTFALATAGQGGKWNIVRTGTSVPLNVSLAPGQNADLRGTIASISIDNGLDLSKCWVVVRIDDTPLNVPTPQRHPGHAYVHSARDIFGARR